MDFPIVSVTTKDKLKLHGLYLRPKTETNVIQIHIHGTAGSFFWNGFFPAMAEESIKQNRAFLSTNNRGAFVYQIEKGTVASGAALERFEDCLMDIDAWIEFAIGQGYKSVILSGHSFGTEKVVYYMNKGNYRDKVRAIVLLGVSDSYGNQKRFDKKNGFDSFEEVKKLVAVGKSEYLLADIYGQSIEVPISAGTYLNFFSEGSELAKVLPLRNGAELKMYGRIRVPILVVISDDEAGEYSIIPIKEALALMKAENPLTETVQITQTDHGFTGKEVELAKVVNDFINRKVGV